MVYIFPRIGDAFPLLFFQKKIILPSHIGRVCTLLPPPTPFKGRKKNITNRRNKKNIKKTKKKSTGTEKDEERNRTHVEI